MPVQKDEPSGKYDEIDNEIKKDIYKYKFKTTKTPIKLKIVATKNRGANSQNRSNSPKKNRQSSVTPAVKKEEIVKMYMNLNTEIE